jgi:hypothetical protein
VAFTIRRGAALAGLALIVGGAAWGFLGAPGPALVLAALGVFVLLLGLGTSGRREPLARTPVAIPPEESEQVEGPVEACLRCGSVDVGAGSVSQGQIPGAGDAFAYVCKRCGHRGAPLRFEDATAYREFVRGLNGP